MAGIVAKKDVGFISEMVRLESLGFTTIETLVVKIIFNIFGRSNTSKLYVGYLFSNLF